MPFTVYDRLVKPIQLDSLWTRRIEVALFAFRPLLLATASAIKPIGELVLLPPVESYHTACDTAHHRLAEWLVAVPGSSPCQFPYDTMSDVPPILCRHFVANTLG